MVQHSEAWIPQVSNASSSTNSQSHGPFCGKGYSKCERELLSSVLVRLEGFFVTINMNYE